MGLWVPRHARQVLTDVQGDLVGTTVHTQLGELDGRLAATKFIDDLQATAKLTDDFFGNGTATNEIGELGWDVIVSGTGAKISNAAFVHEAYGVKFLETGTTTTGRCGIGLGFLNIDGTPEFTCEWRCKIFDAVADVTNDYRLLMGLHDSNGSDDPADGMYFLHSSASANWHAVTAKATVRTNVDTGVPVNTAYHRFRMVSTGTAVHFYIDGTEVSNSPITTNLPAAGGTESHGPALAIGKIAGTSNRRITVDYFGLLTSVAR